MEVADCNRLLQAAKNGQVAYIKMFCSNLPSNLEYIPEYMSTALYRAVINNHPKIVLILLKHGANVHTRDDDCLRQSKNSEITRQLLAFGADESRV